MKKMQLTKPHILVVTGIPGSGKTQFATQFSETFHTPFISAEQLRAHGVPADRIGEVSEYFLAELGKAKQTVLFEERTPHPAERRMLTRIAKAYNYELLYIWVQTDPAIAKTRATKKTTHRPQPLSANAFDTAVADFTKPPKQHETVVISGMHTYPAQAKTVLKKLASTGAAARPITQVIRRSAPLSRRVSS